ncbi:MAG: Dam family site-specific DNA-(adenine-N6)-methyltransferase [Candidatus Thiodiazotropha sp. (ex Myrtea sp. 'scaly one' KF741663)]|nr:Dam family site-specific DNA-(adenine-N6)-methyltransferase [Candidatus Thiodiazotropha sp. (ex Myrtea sp. 'scaly one' KF741663)]
MSREFEMQPFLKWAGGKRWLVSNYKDCIYTEAERYIEPFLGGGAVFFSLDPKKAIIADLNEELINAYLVIRDQPEKVIQQLKSHQRKHNSENNYYYKIRDQSPRTSASKASRFIYLNRTCFNGLYRVNLNGKFNVPKGTKNSVIMESDDFIRMSAYLQKATIEYQDFSASLRKAGAKDFVFIDPPYTVKHNMNNFVKYNETIFSWRDQERLADCAYEAACAGARVLISNADHPSIHKLYSRRIWRRVVVNRNSVIASDSNCRKETTELLISNYLNNQGEQVQVRS